MRSTPLDVGCFKTGVTIKAQSSTDELRSSCFRTKPEYVGVMAQRKYPLYSHLPVSSKLGLLPRMLCVFKSYWHPR